MFCRLPRHAGTVGGRIDDHGQQIIAGEQIARAHQKIAATLDSSVGLDADRTVAAGKQHDCSFGVIGFNDQDALGYAGACRHIHDLQCLGLGRGPGGNQQQGVCSEYAHVSTRVMWGHGIIRR